MKFKFHLIAFLILIAIHSVLGQVIPIGTFKGPLGEVPISANVNYFFGKPGEITLRPIGSNFLKRVDVASDKKQLANLLIKETGNFGLDFPDYNTTIAPEGYFKAWFYDASYNVIGWAFQLEGTNIENYFRTKEEAEAKIRVIESQQPPITETAFIPIPLNTPTAINSGKVTLQVPSHSFGENSAINGMHAIVSANGKKLIEVKCNDNEILPGGHPSNNHMNGFNIVAPAGPINIYYQNANARNQAIMFGIGEIHNNEGYIFYRNYNESLFHQKLDPGQALNTTIHLQEKNDYGYVTAVQENTLHKNVYINLYKNGKIYTDECNFDWWDGNAKYQWKGFMVRCNSSVNITIRSNSNSSDWIQIRVNTGGYGQTGTVTVLARSNLDITEAGTKISTYNFNHSYINAEGELKYDIKEGLKDVPFKTFNNYYKEQ